MNQKSTKNTESKDKKNSIMNAIDHAQTIIEFKTDGTIITANDNFLNALGYELDEIVGKHHRIYYDEQYYKSNEYQHLWKSIIRGDIKSDECKITKKDGTPAWIHASYIPILDDEGKAYKIIQSSIDITKSTLKNYELNRKIEAISRSQAIIEFDTQGYILTANANFLNTMGYSLDDIKGKHHRIFCDASYTETPEYSVFWESLEKGTIQSGEYKRINKKGDYVWISASYDPITDPSGKTYKIVKYATDITKNKIKNADFEGKIEAINRSQAVIEFDLNGYILFANDNFLKAVGYDLDEILGQHHKLFCEKEHVDSVEYKNFWTLLGKGDFNSGEYKRIKKDGNHIWLNASYNPVFDPEGTPYKIVKYATDITPQVEIRETAKTLSLVTNETDNSVIICNAEGKIEYVNPGFTKLSGYTLEEAQGKKPGSLLQGKHTCSKTRARIREKLQKQEPFYDEIVNYSKLGEAYWISLAINPIFDKQGKLDKFISIQTNITQTKLEQLDFNAKLDAISETHAIIEFSPQGDIITANKNFCDVTEYTLSEIEGKHHSMFLDEEYVRSADYVAFWDKLRRNEYDSGKYKRITKNGKEIWLQASYTPIVDQESNVIKVVKFANDITSQVQLEKEITKIAVDFATTTKDISIKANTVAEGSQSLGATTEEMNASVEELSASIDSIAMNSQDADAIAKNTQVEADNGTKAINKSIESMELINKSSEEISEIVKVISEIASQTNLLAFNAAIEAARAGEHGLGFSVVADEVRKLAERSSQATKGITKLINESVKRVVQGSEISKEAATAFEKIVEGVSKTTMSISEISVAAQEQQTAARDVSNAIQNVVDSTEQSAIASEGIANATNDLSIGAEKLQQQANKFATDK